jgi:TolB protein
VKEVTMSLRWRVIGLCGLLGLTVLLLGLAHRGSQASHLAAVTGVPATAQETVQEVLAAAGYHALAEPVWAGPTAGWQAPGSYRVFFVAPTGEGEPDVYMADVRVDAKGQVTRATRITQLTDTPAGEESAPVLTDGWLAFATRVAGYYQSIACVPLADARRPDVFAFGRPVEQVELSWSSSPEGPTLRVTAGQPAHELAIEPVTRRIEPADADLQYLPVVRGEQAWLPNLVSRVRELPGVGPEKIAFLENVFFTFLDYVTRLWHGQATPPVVQEVTPPTAPSVMPSATPQPSSPVPLARGAAPSVTPTPLPTATPTATPTPEGKPLADGIVWRTTLNPDPQRPYANVEVIDIDPGLLQIKMVCGTHEPKPSTGLVGSGVILREDWPSLVAGFNGGFAAMHGQYGMMVDRKVYLPARDGIATLAVYEDGSLKMGTWGKDLTLTPDMVSYRQNCPPLIENGIITAETGKLTLWGLSVANEVYLYRSGLGITADGRLIYVVGKPLSAYTLARAMQMAGAQYAMQLDVDEFHVVFITYDVQTVEGAEPKVTGQKLRADMRGFDSLFLRPFQLDFFYLVRRPERLEQAVRLAPRPQAPEATPTLVSRELPGRIAFASDRDGNWELYAMRPGQPGSVERLTDHPADDLYPAWSPDGTQLACASRRDGNSEIYIMDVATGGLRRVTDQGSEEWAPAWSPDGHYLAYQSDRNGQSDVYVCAVDGSDETRLTPMEGNHEAPHWSPDGKRIVFDSDLDVAELVHASINLYIMNADGSNPRRIISYAESPRWSPDGRTIAFTTRWTGRWQVYLANADGSGARRLTNVAHDTRYPAWSPDGRWLAFAGNEEGHWELYAISVDGGQPLRLTASSGDSTYPVWGP